MCEGMETIIIALSLIAVVLVPIILCSRRDGCRHKFENGAFEKRSVGCGLQVRSQKYRCTKCGKKGEIVGLWFVHSDGETTFEHIVPTYLMSRKPQ